ncbi:hypothetical protein DL767_005387 [Monosporascus sp. MG133]|nr:hypothetical protein DL767_005387 [Monosporascus sp. MG133]
MDFMGWLFIITLLWQSYETYKFVLQLGFGASTALAAVLRDENTLSERNLAEHAFSEHASSGRNSSQHNCAEEHALALNPDLVNRGQSNYFTPRSHAAWDLMTQVPQSFGNGDPALFTPEQSAARDEFVNAYLSYPEDNLTLEQVDHLMQLLDAVFFSSSLVNGPERLVGLEFMGHDPQSWRRIYWRGRRLRAYLVAYTRYRANISDQGTRNLQPPVTIVLPRVFGGRPLTKLQLSAALAHEMVHAFIAWHWNGCPLLDAIAGLYENGHGVVFWRILASINMTVASWHEEFREFGAAADIVPPPTWKTSAAPEGSRPNTKNLSPLLLDALRRD